MTTKTKNFFDRTAFLKPPVIGDPTYEDWGRMLANQQAMLATDGSMTLLLSGLYGEAIGVQLLHQAEQRNKKPDPALQTNVGATTLERTILLKTVGTKQTVAYAESSIATDRLPATLRNDLHDGDKAIGLVLRDHAVPTFRYLERWGRVPEWHIANRHLPKKIGAAGVEWAPFFRSYIINANIPGSGTDETVPIMRVSEYFLFKLLDKKGA